MNRNYLIIFFSIISTTIFPESITLLIDSPGQYRIGTDLIASPTDANDAIITVSASNVILDIEHHLVMQDPLNTVTGLTGIRIEPNFRSIFIKNANINDITGVGVEIAEGSEGISIEDSRILRCSAGGVRCNGISSNPINTVQILNSTISSCTGVGGNPAIGLFAQNTRTLFLEDSEIVKNDAVITSSGYGCFIESCTGISVKNCLVSANGGFGEGAGLFIKNSINAAIRNSFFNINISRSSASTARAGGIFLDNCGNIRLEASELSSNINPFARVFGLYAMNSSDVILLGCVIESNKGGAQATGIRLENTLRCQLNRNLIRSIEGATAYGIRLTGTNTSANILNNALSSGIGITTYGIIDELNPSVSAFTGNRVFDFVTSYSVSYPSGIMLPIIEGSLSNPVTGLPTDVGGLLDNVSIES